MRDRIASRRAGAGVVFSGAAAALALILTVVVSGCTSTTGGSPTPASTAAPVPVGLGRGLAVTVPAAVTVTPFALAEAERADCVLADAKIASADTAYQLQLVRDTCPQKSQRALNGNHGQYLVPPFYALDVSAPATVPTGSLVTFRQTYTECTNSCTDYTDSVGLITLSEPADPDAPVLMILLPRQDDERIADVAALAGGLTNG